MFGEVFYNPNGCQTDLFDLHDEFLNFMDEKNDADGEEVSLFIEQLEKNPMTNHFLSILRAEKVIEEKE